MGHVSLVSIAAFAALFAWLAVKAFRARRTWVRFVAGPPAAIVALIALAAWLAAARGWSRVDALHSSAAQDLHVALTPERIAYGEKLAMACSGCHSPRPAELPLTGRDLASAGQAPPVGTLWAPNLTPAHLADWTDGEIVRAIREGVRKDGRSLILMPSSAFHSMSDDDVHAIVAYLRSQPAVEPASPPRRISLVGALLFGTVLPQQLLSVQPPISAPVVAPPPGPTAERGRYVTAVYGCRDCHGEDLHGLDPAKSKGPPAGPDLIAIAAQRDEDLFLRTLRTCTRPDGTPIPEAMPCKEMQSLDDDDFRAVHAYLATLASP